MKEIYPNLYLNEIPLSGNSLGILNCYLIPDGEGGGLAIDAGFGTRQGLGVFLSGLEALDMEPSRTRLLITHMHPDHCGLAAELSGRMAGIDAGVHAAETFRQVGRLMSRDPAELAELAGLDSMALPRGKEAAGAAAAAAAYMSLGELPFRALGEGRRLSVGGFSFTVTELPGHAPDQIGLYDGDKRLLICGDHILDKISPNVSNMAGGRGLSTYFESLDKVAAMEPELLLPAHGGAITEPLARIDQLREHQRRRLKEVEDVLRSGDVSIADTAKRLHWDVSAPWRELSAVQELFALGETWAHLEYLLETGAVGRYVSDGVIYYRRLDNVET